MAKLKKPKQKVLKSIQLLKTRKEQHRLGWQFDVSPSKKCPKMAPSCWKQEKSNPSPYPSRSPDLWMNENSINSFWEQTHMQAIHLCFISLVFLKNEWNFEFTNEEHKKNANLNKIAFAFWPQMMPHQAAHKAEQSQRQCGILTETPTTFCQMKHMLHGWACIQCSP